MRVNSLRALEEACDENASMYRTRYEKILKVFAKELRKARLRAGFRSAQGFAEKIGLEPHTYRKYERGNTHPNFEVLVRICENLGVTPNDLLPEVAINRPFQLPTSQKRFSS